MTTETAITPETPTQILNVTGDKATVKDARGRVIVVTRLSALNFYRLTKALGPTASNAAAADIAMLAASVRKIDTSDFSVPTKEQDVEFIVQQLDFDGLAAVGEGLKQLGEQTQAGVDAAKN